MSTGSHNLAPRQGKSLASQLLVTVRASLHSPCGAHPDACQADGDTLFAWTSSSALCSVRGWWVSGSVSCRLGSQHGWNSRCYGSCCNWRVLFGLDQGNWGEAILKEPFIRIFCHGSWRDCSDASQVPAAYAEFLSLGSSFLQLGAASGALVSAPLAAGRWGHHEAKVLGSLITISGCVPQSFVSSEPCFLAARVLAED